MQPPSQPAVQAVPVVVLGAGVAGLTCARALQAAGRDVLVVDKSHGVGGRCATRRAWGQPVDHGLSFFHGHDDDFLAALRAVPDGRREGWPRRVVGGGPPCAASAFSPRAQRLAFASGVNAFPKHLAQGLALRLDAEVTRVEPTADGFLLHVRDAPAVLAGDLVLALPAPQALALLPEGGGADAQALRRLCALPVSVPCATVVAVYPLDAPHLDFDAMYPEASPALQLIAHDSSKREAPAYTALVMQARPGWSRAHLGGDPETWSAQLLAEAAGLLGPWVARPAWRFGHRWRYARLDGASELASPLLLRWPGSGRLGVTGEAFAPGGDVQAAFLAGQRLARRLLGGQTSGAEERA